MGTFGGALEARQIDASNGKLTAEVTGEVETEDGVLVIRRIHVAMRLVARRTHARHLRHALPALPDIAQDDPTQFVFRVGDSGNRALKS